MAKPSILLAAALAAASLPWLAASAEASNPQSTGSDNIYEGLPGSDSLGTEDIWHNPTFRGGVVNGGAGAHSTW